MKNGSLNPEIKARLLLEKIISKGGLVGKCASFYVDDPILTDQFIRECSEQLHNKSAIDHWGKELVLEIRNYVKKKYI